MDGIIYQKDWLCREHADHLFAQLKLLKWKSEHIFMFGRRVKVPRKVIWIGDPDANYTYSQTSHFPEAWPDCLLGLRDLVSRESECEFNSALLNLYLDGRDYMGWHSDNEPELGEKPIIASISLGANRRFLFKSKNCISKYEYLLEHGSLLIMKEKTQEIFKHSLPKMLRVKNARINITFRKVQV